ncbi:beta-ketoacyl reductase [Aspergillus tanneri]|uniref:Carrier domain-containing protein n=1 Tax=Aspergillus tanneri TaxID=1220188 RepID=A0A5M9MRI6_9EURO|nr:uncharacterized protein ATNIH1004_002179 [Aspergillus tanneri]KAA8649508.1 hypothetical protein ATNIH1004_002179 [Aspergillus tanneri]
MVSRGAGNLILLSRSGAQTSAAKSFVYELKGQGVCVATPKVDISDLANLKESSIVSPARCLQCEVASKPLLLYRAQANYATGNTFKDALAHYRLVHRQKAVSIDLGLMVSEGVVAQNELIALLDHYCNLSLPLLSADDAQVIVGIEMSSTVVAKVVDNTNTAAINRSTALKVAMSPDEAAKFLGMSSSDVEPSKPIHAYGIDSLVAVDLKNWFEREVGANVSVFDLMGNLSFRQLSALAAEQSRFRS